MAATTTSKEPTKDPSKEPVKDTPAAPAKDDAKGKDEANQDAKSKDDKQGVPPGAVTAASAGAPGYVPGQEVGAKEAFKNTLPTTPDKDGKLYVSTVSESGSTSQSGEPVHIENEKPLTGVNPVTGQPHDGAAVYLRSADFAGAGSNLSSDQLKDEDTHKKLGGRAGFDRVKSLAASVEEWHEQASDSLGDLKKKAGDFVDAFKGLFKDKNKEDKKDAKK